MIEIMTEFWFLDNTSSASEELQARDVNRAEECGRKRKGKGEEKFEKLGVAVGLGKQCKRQDFHLELFNVNDPSLASNTR